MRIRFQVLGVLLIPALAVAQDVETQYLRLQESYSQRLLDLEETYETQQRELLNKFILALIRMEQSYREQGDLEGVVMSRDLRESLLMDPKNLEPDENRPPRLQEMFDELMRLKKENLNTGQQKLNELNAVLLRALEPYKVEFTRQGNLEQAIEIRDLQAELSRGLGLEVEQPRPVTAPRPTTPDVSIQDPNAYAFLLEPEVYRTTQGVTPRKAFVKADPEVTGDLNITESAYHFTGGQMLVHGSQLEAFRGMVARNSIFTFEFAISASGEHQGAPNRPAVVFCWGDSVEGANLAVTQEKNRLFLYLKTTLPPEGRKTYRIELGPVEANQPSHFMMTFRGSDLTLYRDGTAIQRLRGTVKGSLAAWTPSAITFSHTADKNSGTWSGYVYQMSLKAGQESTRKLEGNFDRFQTVMQR